MRTHRIDYRNPGRIDRPWRHIVCASVCAAGIIGGEAVVAAESSTTSRSSDWFSSSSGWQNANVYYGTTAPAGNWDFDYKHYTGFPPAWANNSSPAKPAAAAWGTVANFTASTSSTGPPPLAATSTMQSEWYVDPYTGFALFGGGYYAKYSTRSTANAVAPNVFAMSETRIVDPWTVPSPATDPNWPGAPLDPDGLWRARLSLALAGSLRPADGSASLGCSYRFALNSMSPGSAEPMLSVLVTDEGAAVSRHPDIVLSMNGQELDEQAVEDILNSYFLENGDWELAPDIDWDTFEPDQSAHLAQVFALEATLLLDAHTSFVTFFTETGGACESVAHPPVQLVFSNPPDGLLDPLQNALNYWTQSPQGIGGTGTPPAGPVQYSWIHVEFSGPISPAPTPSNVVVTCTNSFASPPGNDAPCPTVIFVTPTEGTGSGYDIFLSSVIPTRECTTIEFAGTVAGQRLQYRSLPGDVDLSGASNTADLLVFVQAFNNGSAGANFARYDVNRSGVVNTQGLLRVVQLLNGVNTTEAFNGKTVAACPP